ncbi:MAG TPA: branched-chain amino acid ABC transporter permease [Dehalococcoidia bacterium]|nr:branched-chain amino acid ABC transporter permease [Dehalococcoidia bacterium]
MDTFIQLVISGLATGSVYGSLGLAVVFILRSTRALNFAQGEMATFGAFLGWSLLHTGMDYWLAFAVLLPISFLAGFGLHRVIIRPFEQGAFSRLIMVVLGVFVALNGIVIYIWGGVPKSIESPFRQEPYEIGGVFVSAHDIGTIIVMLVMLVVIYLLFNRTMLGLAMRATAENRASSQLLGIPVGLMLGVGWGLAAVIGSIAAMMTAPKVVLDPTLMLGVLLYMFAAITLGGFESPVGAVVGGFLVGVGENLVGHYVDFIGTELRLPAALFLIILVLMVRPEGLFGKPHVQRV